MSKKAKFEDFVDETSGLVVRKTEWTKGEKKISQKTKPLTDEELSEIWEEVRIDANR